jgi:hypothetical protein
VCRVPGRAACLLVEVRDAALEAVEGLGADDLEMLVDGRCARGSIYAQWKW